MESKCNETELKSTSNIRNDINEYPSYEEFYHFNIVIATLVTTGRLVQMSLEVDHFQYISIDECAASTELESIIPILGKHLIMKICNFHSNYFFLRRFSNGFKSSSRKYCPFG